MKRIILFLSLFIPSLLFAQTSHPETLFSVGGENVSADEFVKVYLNLVGNIMKVLKIIKNL